MEAGDHEVAIGSARRIGDAGHDNFSVALHRDRVYFFIETKAQVLHV